MQIIDIKMFFSYISVIINISLQMQIMLYQLWSRQLFFLRFNCVVMLIATCHSYGFFLNNRFWNLSWSWQWCIICSKNYQMTCGLAHDWKYVMVYVIHGWSGARSFFPGYFFLRYSSYYWVTDFYYGSFRQFLIISDLIFIINVVYNIVCEYIVPLFPFCFALLIIDCGTHCDNISNIITAFISVFQICTVMLYCDAVSYPGGILAFFRVVSDFV